MLRRAPTPSLDAGAPRRTARRLGPLATVTLVLATVSPLGAQTVRWTGSAGYARGSYVFAAATQTLSLSTGLSVEAGPLEFSASLPFLLQNSGLVSQVAGVPLPTGGQENGAVGDRGPGQKLGSGGTGGTSQTDSVVTFQDEFTASVGDPFISAAGSLFEGVGTLRSLRVSGFAKVPLRDLDSGVGTGEWDVGVGASAFASAGDFFLFADAGYWWYGDLPDLELVDGPTYGFGISRALFDARGSIMLSFIGAAAIIESMDAPTSLALGLGYTPSAGRSISLGASAGLSESAPDFSIYFGWSLTLAQ